jgi:exopolysaccharide/PEP-CTERM locus tyrosine autokinase
MSRIERAIEKATKLRDEKSSGMKEKKTEIPSHMPSAPEKAKREMLFKMEDANIDPHIVALQKPYSSVVEEYRKLISSIDKMNRHQESIRNVLVITSSIGGEGKSITAINLAITMAQNYDNTVLLIDADIRRPSIHKYLNIKTGKGLSDCIIDGIDVGSALLKTGLSNLKFMSAGKHVENPVEILSSKTMRGLLEDLKYRYADRYIIIDASPVLPFAETRLLCSLADGVIFIVKDGLTTVQNVTESMEILESAKVLGVVYNDVSMESVSNSYLYNYYNYYADYKNMKVDG